VATEQYANNAQSSLTAAVAAGDTTLTVGNASAFPASGNFRVIIDAEILLVTAVAGNTFTVTRGAEGTTAAAHAVGAYVTHVLTAAALSNCPRAMTAGGDVEYLAASGAVARRAIGSAGQVLTVVSGLPAWQNAAASADMLAALVNTPNLITNADANLTSATWNVVKATTGAHTVTLPAPSAGLVLGVRIDPASTKLVTLGQHATDLIDGQAARVMWAGEKAVLLSDGTDWFKVAGQSVPMVCSMYASSGQTITSGSQTPIALDTAVVDNTGLMADTTNQRISILRPNPLTVIGSVRWNNLSVDTARVISVMSVVQQGIGATNYTGEQSALSGSYPFVSVLSGFLATGTSSPNYAGLSGNQLSGANQGTYGGILGSYLTVIEVPSW
jgi:hypothetical protein